jgi:hypothetical protein
VPPSASPVCSTKHRKAHLHDDGQGDYRIRQVFTAEGAEIPKDSLIVVPGAPGFETSAGALKWVKEYGHQLSGMTVAVIKVCELLRVTVEPSPSVKVVRKPKHILTDEYSDGRSCGIPDAPEDVF